MPCAAPLRRFHSAEDTFLRKMCQQPPTPTVPPDYETARNEGATACVRARLVPSHRWYAAAEVVGVDAARQSVFVSYCEAQLNRGQAAIELPVEVVEPYAGGLFAYEARIGTGAARQGPRPCDFEACGCEGFVWDPQVQHLCGRCKHAHFHHKTRGARPATVWATADARAAGARERGWGQ